MTPREIHATVVLVRGDAEVAAWPLTGTPDLALVDDLARLHLAAKRAGCAIRLRDTGAAFAALLDLIGLRETLGQAERREDRRVDEVVVTDDDAG